MRRSSPIFLSIALLSACGYASAAASQHMSADGSSSCPDSTVATNDRSDLGDADPAAAALPPVRRTEKAKAAAAPRASGTRAAAPRWHSFLPGMFR